MWNLQIETLEKHLGKLPSVAIETGTCRGNGTRALATRFKRVVSIELSQELYSQAKEKLSSPEFSHVELIHGNSAEKLVEVLTPLNSKEPVFIFLDAHWSGDQSVNWASARWKGYGIDTAHMGSKGKRPSGPEQVPLISELQIIMKHCRGPAHILIDDMKNIPTIGAGLTDHEFPGEDWSHLSREVLMSIVRPRLAELRELTNPSQWLLSLNEL